MKGGTAVGYRLSPNEEARLIKEEREKRRKLRLLQVREQAKLNAAKIRNAVKEEKSKQLQILADEIKQQWEEEMQEKHRKLEESYNHSLKRIGEGHRSASQYDPKTEMKAILAQEDKRRAKERHKAALERQRQEQELQEAEDNKHIFARLAALEVEKLRAADIASLPPPPPNPVDACLGVKVKPVQFTDLNAFSTTHFHIPTDCAVARATEHEQIDAKASAEEEDLKVRDLDAEKRRLEIERKEKARLRHKAAKEKEMLRQDYDHMLLDLSNLQREDRSRRQNIVHKVPKQIFQPPHRRLEEKEDNQKDMERVFEDMYMAATDYIGDLSLALDPHPALETPTATESLELSTMEEDEGQAPTPRRPQPEGVLQDVTNRSLPSLKDHLKDKDQAKDTTLRKLLDRIKAQREEWISKSSVDEENTEQEASEASSAVSTQGKTLTQYTITSGEPSNSEAETLSTGEVSQTGTTQSSKRTAETDSSRRQARYNGGGSLEEGTITSSSTAVEERNGAMLHPLEKADKARQYKQREEDLSAFLAAEREKQEQMKLEQERIIEQTVQHQRELEHQKYVVEQRLKDLQLQENSNEDFRFPLGYEGQTLPSGQYSTGNGQYTLPMSSLYGEEAVYQPAPRGSQQQEPSLSDYSQGQFSRSVPVNGHYQPLEPDSDVSRFSHSLPASHHSESLRYSFGHSTQDHQTPAPQQIYPQEGLTRTQYSSVQNGIGSDDNGGNLGHYGIPGQKMGAVDSMSDKKSGNASGQRSDSESLDSTPPFARAHKQMQNIQSFQDNLMKRHHERQQKLYDGRVLLKDRAKVLLDDSLHQAGLNPIYGGRHLVQNGQFNDLGHFHDVDFSVSTERTHSHLGHSDSRRTSGNNTSPEATHAAGKTHGPLRISANSGSAAKEFNDRQSEVQKQLEEIERQKEEIMERDRQHNVHMERLRSEWQTQYDQSQHVEGILQQSQATARMENSALQAVENDLENRERAMGTGDIYRDRELKHMNSGDIYLNSDESEQKRADLSTIVEQETPTSHMKPRDFLTQEQNLSDGSHCMSPGPSSQSLPGEGPNELIGLVGQVDPHPPISDQLAQLQKDINQLHAHSNSYLQLKADTTDPESDSQSVELSSDGMALESSQSRFSKTSDTQQVIDELISPLRNGHQNKDHSFGSNKSNGSQNSSESQKSDSRTWHQKLLGIGSPQRYREDDRAELYGNDPYKSGEFFELRPEFSSPSPGDRGFDRNHRLSSTPVSKQETPEFQPLRPEENSVMSAEAAELSQYPLHSQNDTRLQSVRSEPGRQTLMSELSQYPLVGSDTDLRIHRGESSSGDSFHKVFETPAGENASQSLSQHPLAEESSGRHSPTIRYVSDPYVSSDDSSSRIRENSEALTKRIEATLGMHEQLLRESKEIRERHASQRMSPVRHLSYGSQDKLQEAVESSPGISEEPDLTLVSAANSSMTEDMFHPLQPSPDKQHISLLSFEGHEQSLSSESSTSKFSPLRELNSGEWRERTGVRTNLDQANGYRQELVEKSDSSQNTEGSSIQDMAEDVHQQTESLQEAFAKKKSEFAKGVSRRQAEAKEKARKTTRQTSAKGRPPGLGQAHMSKTLASWKKSHTSKPSGVKRPDTTSIVTVTTPERKKREVDMKKRTDRLYNQLDEVKQKKMEDERKAEYAKNREKAKEYQQKHLEKIQKKSK